jgi:hypothetical protein
MTDRMKRHDFGRRIAGSSAGDLRRNSARLPTRIRSISLKLESRFLYTFPNRLRSRSMAGGQAWTLLESGINSKPENAQKATLYSPVQWMRFWAF